MVHRVACLALVLGGIACILLRDRLPHRLGSYGGMVGILTGNLLAMPLYVAWMARLVQPLARAALGIEARLAADNLLRSPGRTGVVIGALAAGVALMVQIAGVGRSNEEPVIDWLDRAVTADLFVMSGSLAVGDEVARADGRTRRRRTEGLTLDGQPLTEWVVGLRFYRPQFNGTAGIAHRPRREAYHDATIARSPRPMPNMHTFHEY